MIYEGEMLTMKRSVLKIVTVIILSFAFILPLSGPSLAAPLTDTSNVDEWDLENIPVIYNGNEYTVEEFLKIKDSLSIAVYYPDRSTGKKLLYAFSSFEELDKRFGFKINLPDPNSNVNSGGNGIKSEDPGYGYVWVNTYKGGNCLAIQAGLGIADLSSCGWDNKISSATYVYISGYTYGTMILCGGTNYAQPVFIVPIGYYYPTLPEFDNVTSSICWQ
jgi:hypothetical protein